MKKKNLIGKTLGEVMRTQEGTFFIGARTSFFFCGTPERWKETRSRIQAILKQDHNARVNAPNFQKFGKEKIVIPKKPEEIIPFIPLSQRKIIDAYDRTKRDGTVLIIEGDDSGNCWNIDEFETWIHKRRPQPKKKAPATPHDNAFQELAFEVVKNLVDDYKAAYRYERSLRDRIIYMADDGMYSTETQLKQMKKIMPDYKGSISNRKSYERTVRSDWIEFLSQGVVVGDDIIRGVRQQIG